MFPDRSGGDSIFAFPSIVCSDWRAGPRIIVGRCWRNYIANTIFTYYNPRHRVILHQRIDSVPADVKLHLAPLCSSNKPSTLFVAWRSLNIVNSVFCAERRVYADELNSVENNYAARSGTQKLRINTVKIGRGAGC